MAPFTSPAIIYNRTHAIKKKSISSSSSSPSSLSSPSPSPPRSSWNDPSSQSDASSGYTPTSPTISCDHAATLATTVSSSSSIRDSGNGVGDIKTSSFTSSASPSSLQHTNAAGEPMIPVPPQEYELFAVVNHHGKLDNGHYTSFVRHTLESGVPDAPVSVHRLCEWG